jgi:hypothetical protein
MANEQDYASRPDVRVFACTHCGRHGLGFRRRPREMFTLFFESREKVLLVRYSGVFTSEDISMLDAVTVGIVAQEGYVRSIFDCTDVRIVAISRSSLSERARKLRMNPGKDRVTVAPQQEIYELFRDYAQAQLDFGNGELMVVRTLGEALEMLRLSNPDFQPIAVNPPSTA